MQNALFVSYCKHFLYNCKQKNEHKANFVTALELRETLNTLIKIDRFPDKMQNNETSVSNSRLISLNPFVDKEDVGKINQFTGHYQ